MANVEILPAGSYKVVNVGPTRDWKFNSNGEEVEMSTDSVVLEGAEQYWIDVNRSRAKDQVKIGDTLKGDVSQDAEGKYNPKFNKEKGGGGGGRWNGGGQASPGAKWSSATDTAARIVVGYYTARGEKPESIKEFLQKIKKVTPAVNKMVDEFVAGEKKAAPAKAAPATESGESPATPAAPAPKPAAAPVEVEDINDDELGDW